MKLTEFSQPLFESWITELNEAFNTKFDIQWQQHGSVYMGLIEVNNVPYVVQLHKPIVAPVIGKSVVEVSFFLYNEHDDKASFSTAKELTAAPTAVYGAVLNAALEKIDNFDGLYFTAEKQHSNGVEFEKKQRIYVAVAKRASRELGGTVYVRMTDHELQVLWMEKPLENPGTWKRPEESLTMSKKK